MMPKLEVFFDYSCPYCMRGHGYLTELLPQYPDIEIEWHPCETHPRPEQYGPHSDLCARGMYFASDHGADMPEYHIRMFNAALKKRVNIEDLNAVTEIADGLLNRDNLREALSGKRYEDNLSENNRLAWDVYNFPAVPSYRMDGHLLESIPGIGMSRDRLAAFLTKYCKT